MDPVIVRQRPLSGDLDALTDELTTAFCTLRDAVNDALPVIVVVSDRDLLGQGEPVDAALATGLLGLARAFSLEGAKPGWCVNAVAHRDGDLDPALISLLGESGLSGQLLRTGTEHIGKVSP